MEPWYKVGTSRVEVWEGRSFHPYEFAVGLEQALVEIGVADRLRVYIV